VLLSAQPALFRCAGDDVCVQKQNKKIQRPHFLATMKQTATTWLPLLLLTSVFLASCSALAPPARSFRRRSQLESHRLGAVDRTRIDAAVAAETFKLGECWYFPPAATTAVSRRSLFAIMSVGLAIAAAPEVSQAASATAVNDDAAVSAAAAKERMAQRIADSKLKYRKPTDLVKDRKDNTDYSCVAATGSPCPEGLVPRSVQRELVGALELLK
jgi:hypothetical protein